MNYDETELPDQYDRARRYTTAALVQWMDRVASACAERVPHTILDLGCGTGRFATALSEHFGADVFALDPSAKMLAQARAKPADDRVTYVRAAAEAIPLPDASVDLVFMSMVFHHFADPARVASECQRVLRRAGVAFLRTPTREHATGVPYLPFFPTARQLFEQRMPTQPQIRETFLRAGFTSSQHTAWGELAPHWRAYADKVALKGDSILVSLSAREFETGLELLRTFAKSADEQPVLEPIAYFVLRPVGLRAEG